MHFVKSASEAAPFQSRFDLLRISLPGSKFPFQK